MNRILGHGGSPEKETAIETIYNEVIDEAILGFSFQVHRSIKQGTYFLEELDDNNEKEYAIVDEVGLDVFGQVPMKKQLECTCPNCQRNLAASRFAPHLEKCMGMGRSSSRIANRRIANSGKDAGSDDDENDDDWTYSSDRKGAKKKRERLMQGGGRKPKALKLKNGDASSVGSNISDSGSSTNYENMSADERKGMLMQMCGVISEHTKKMCTRSLRCPQHSDEQRKAVRGILLGPQSGLFEVSDDIQVDIDSFDDIDSSQRDHLSQLWEGGLSTNPSPTDSSSTNNSSTSTKKKEAKTKSGGNNGRNKKANSGGSQNTSSPKGKSLI